MAASKKKKTSGTSSGSSSTSGSGSSSGGGGSTLRNVVVGAVGTDALIDLVNRLGLVDIVLGRVKSRLEETDVDELLEEVTDYLRRNPEVLVVSLGAITVATGLLVWLNNRREWDGTERRTSAGATTSPGRVKRTTRVPDEYSDSDDDE